jgi:hypothetical protein
MGISEWGISIMDLKDFKKVRKVINNHNKLFNKSKNPYLVGEQLTIHSILKFNGRYYMILSNCGGRDSTTEYLIKKLKCIDYIYESDLLDYYTSQSYHILFQPFNKPEGWNECNDYIWKEGSDDPTDDLFI